VGRFKLGAGAVGGCKATLEAVVPYVQERRQFGKSLSEFGLIRAKLADIAAATFAAESMVYRTAGLLDRAIAKLDRADPLYHRKTIETVEEFTIECSMIKVFASEAVALAAEEGLQCLGGYGFCEDYPLERIYRDERINRIFEGTNEINRMLIPGVLLRKALKNELPFFCGRQAGRRRADGAAVLHGAGRARLSRGRVEARRIDEKGAARRRSALPRRSRGVAQGSAGGPLRRRRHRHGDLCLRIGPVARPEEGATRRPEAAAGMGTW
jgi:hypothetical protein